MFLEYDGRIEFKMSKHFRLMKLKKTQKTYSSKYGLS